MSDAPPVVARLQLAFASLLSVLAPRSSSSSGALVIALAGCESGRGEGVTSPAM